MCVQTRELKWEGPAEKKDLPFLAKHFPGIDFAALLEAMSVHGFRPLTSDLVLVAAMIAVPADKLGVKYVPFAGINTNSPSTVIKLSVMEQIVAWMENSALGSVMWAAASDWVEEHYGFRLYFAMDCGCGLTPLAAHEDGRWAEWLQQFNASRYHAYGRSNVEWRDSNTGTDITADQLLVWHRIRAALEALPARAHQIDTDRIAA